MSTPLATQVNLLNIVMQMLVLYAIEMMPCQVAEKTGFSVQVENGFMRNVVWLTTMEIQNFAPAAWNNLCDIVLCIFSVMILLHLCAHPSVQKGVGEYM